MLKSFSFKQCKQAQDQREENTVHLNALEFSAPGMLNTRGFLKAQIRPWTLGDTTNQEN